MSFLLTVSSLPLTAMAPIALHLNLAIDGISLNTDSVTTFILVRHAETTGMGADPELSELGMARVDRLQSILSATELDAVYSTALNRTRMTAQLIASTHSLVIQEYNPFDLKPFVDSIMTEHRGGTVLVVGHSNTTPALLNRLLGENTYSLIPEHEYENLYIVAVLSPGEGKVVHLKYGEN